MGECLLWEQKVKGSSPFIPISFFQKDMWFLKLYFDFIFYMPEFILIFYILIFTIYGLVYEKSKNYIQLASTLSNVASLVLIFIIFLIIHFYWMLFFNSFEKDWLARNVLFEGSYDLSKFALFNKIICSILGISCLQVSKTYFNFKKFYYFEVVVLILIIVLGGFVVTASLDLIFFYVGMEVISLSLYVLISLKKNEKQAIESSIKYFILSSIASACIVFGAALLYSIVGTTNLPMLSGVAFKLKGSLKIRFFVGSFLILVGMLYKLAGFPFHYWVGDVYLGAPSPVVLVMTTLSKYPMIVFLLKLNFYIFHCSGPVIYFIYFSGIFSILVGSFYAYGQNEVKRIIAYSSIVHSGFIFLGVSSSNFFSYTGVVTYSLIYFITSFSFFSFFLSCYKGGSKKMFLHVKDYTGLGEQQPLVAFILTISFFSFMGIPPLIGFFGKYFILFLAITKIKILHLLIILLITIIGSLYYFRFIRNIYFRETDHWEAPLIKWEENKFGYFFFILYGVLSLFGFFFFGYFIAFLEKIIVLGFH